MSRLQLFIRRHQSIAYLILIQASAWLISEFLNFLFPSLRFYALNKFSLEAPWSYITFSVLPYPHFFYVLFDLMWLYSIGILLRDFRKDSFVWKTYFFGVYISYFLFVAISYYAPLPSYAVFGAPLGNLAVLVATATLIPNFKIPLFLLGNVAVKWLVLAYGGLTLISTISTGRNGFYLVLFAAAVGFVMAKYYYKLSFYEVKEKLTPERSLRKKKRKLSEEEELDRILDKISKVGYNKLTQKEKNFLKRLSKEDK